MLTRVWSCPVRSLRIERKFLVIFFNLVEVAWLDRERSKSTEGDVSHSKASTEIMTIPVPPWQHFRFKTQCTYDLRSWRQQDSKSI